VSHVTSPTCMSGNPRHCYWRPCCGHFGGVLALDHVSLDVGVELARALASNCRGGWLCCATGRGFWPAVIAPKRRCKLSRQVKASGRARSSAGAVRHRQVTRRSLRLSRVGGRSHGRPWPGRASASPEGDRGPFLFLRGLNGPSRGRRARETRHGGVAVVRRIGPRENSPHLLLKCT
jgi:hypothetical protein